MERRRLGLAAFAQAVRALAHLFLDAAVRVGLNLLVAGSTQAGNPVSSAVVVVARAASQALITASSSSASRAWMVRRSVASCGATRPPCWR